GVAAAPSQARLGQPEGRTRSPRLLRRRQRLLQPPRPPPCRQRRDARRDAVGRKAGGDRLGAALGSVPAIVDLGYSCKPIQYCYTSWRIVTVYRRMRGKSMENAGPVL